MVRRISEKTALYAEFVKFEHTLFALPFAFSAMVLGCASWPQLWTLVWVLMAMVGGRTYAMGVNRLADAHIDKLNPRTQNRPLPSGRISWLEGGLLTLGGLAILVAATFQLPILCVRLLPVAWVILTLYSFMKRFSFASHFVLGLALGSSAIGGWLAVTGQWSWIAVLFGAAILFWVAGFDIIYACLDVHFDRQTGLYSVPAQFGVGIGLCVSRLCHMLTVALLITTGLFLPNLSGMYWLAVLLTAMMLVYEHQLVHDRELSRVNEAFFNVNGLISLSVMVLVVVDRLIFLSSP